MGVFAYAAGGANALNKPQLNEMPSRQGTVQLIPVDGESECQKEKENKEILSKYEKRSQNILNDNFVIENFRNFTKKEVQKYLNGLD